MTSRPRLLPPSLPPRLLSKEMAAEYVGVSPSLFDELVAGGVMPRPSPLGRRRVWDRVALDKAVDRLPRVANGSR